MASLQEKLIRVALVGVASAGGAAAGGVAGVGVGLGYGGKAGWELRGTAEGLLDGLANRFNIGDAPSINLPNSNSAPQCIDQTDTVERLAEEAAQYKSALTTVNEAYEDLNDKKEELEDDLGKANTDNATLTEQKRSAEEDNRLCLIDKGNQNKALAEAQQKLKDMEGNSVTKVVYEQTRTDLQGKVSDATAAKNTAEGKVTALEDQVDELQDGARDDKKTIQMLGKQMRDMETRHTADVDKIKDLEGKLDGKDEQIKLLEKLLNNKDMSDDEKEQALRDALFRAGTAEGKLQVMTELFEQLKNAQTPEAKEKATNEILFQIGNIILRKTTTSE